MYLFHSQVEPCFAPGVRLKKICDGITFNLCVLGTGQIKYLPWTSLMLFCGAFPVESQRTSETLHIILFGLQVKVNMYIYVCVASNLPVASSIWKGLEPIGYSSASSNRVDCHSSKKAVFNISSVSY